MQYLGTPVLLIVAILLVVGFLYTPQGCQKDGSLGAAAASQLKDPILTIGQSKAYADEARAIVENLKNQETQKAIQQGGVPELSPYQYLSIYAEAASNLMQQASVYELGRLSGIEVSEQDMRDMLLKMGDDIVAGQRQQFELFQSFQIGQLSSDIEKAKKAKAKPEDIAAKEKQLADLKAQSFDQMFQKQQGISVVDFAKKQADDIENRAKTNASIARSIEATTIQQKLVDKYRAGVDTSDNALKASYDKIIYKQIMLSGEDAQSKADEVLKKIRGGLDFTQAAKQFSMMKKPDGSVQLDSTTETRIDMLGDPQKGAILGLKSGEISDVVTSAGMSYIYQLVAIKPDAPKEFESGKKDRAEMLMQQLSNSKLNEEIRKLTGDKGEKVQWTDKGFELLMDYLASVGTEDKATELQTIVSDSQDVPTLFDDIPPIVRFAAINLLQVETKDPAKKKQLDEQLLETYDRVVEIAPGIELRFQYANALIAAGRGDRALELLLDNVMGATPAGDQTAPIVKRVEEMLPKAANLAKKGSTVLAQVQEEIKLWHEDVANRKKEDEDLKKQNAAEEAELKKQEAADKDKAPKTTAPIPEPTPAKPEPIEPRKPSGG